jgi:hemolysin activation/secretion protein
MMRALAIGRKYARPSRRALVCALRAWAPSLCLIFVASAQAQEAGRQPGFDPRRIERSFEPLQSDQRRRGNQDIPVPRVPRAEASRDKTPLFQLKSVSVEGAITIESSVITASYAAYIGKTVSKADLAAMADAVSDTYRAAGYHLSRAIVPPQDVRDGHIRLRVIEGSITDVTLKGNGAERFGIGALLAPVAEERPSRRATLERQLLLVNDRPGVRILDTALEEIGAASGHFRLIVTVETWGVYAAQGVDTFGSPTVGPWEALSTTAFNSYGVAGDSLLLNLSTVPDQVRELQFGELSYDAPVGSSGVRLGGSALYSDVWPGDERRLLDTHTLIETYELRGSFVPLETRRSTLWLTASSSFSDVSEHDAFGFDYRDHLRYLSLTADYKLQDDFAGWNYVTLTLRQGLDILGASQKRDTISSREGALPDFSLIDLSFTRLQTLSDVWSVKLAASGQWASGPLLLSQQFYLGDAAYGPGYYNGDNGFFGLAELRYDQTLPYPSVKGYQIYGFIDRGTVWSYDSNGVTLSLSSVGAGVRFFLLEQVQAGLGFAVPLHLETTANNVRDVRVLFSLTNSFKFCPERPGTRCL